MGNVLRGVLKSECHRPINIMKVDGSVIKLSAPVNIKEIMGDHPDHWVFEADAVRRLGVLSRPLPESAELQRGRLYFLIPLPAQKMGFERNSSGNRLTAASRLHQLEQYPRFFSGRDLARQEIDTGVRIVSSADQGSNVSLKLRHRKEELAKLMSDDRNFMIQQVMDRKSEDLMSRAPSFGWKPSFDSIDERKTTTQMVLRTRDY